MDRVVWAAAVVGLLIISLSGTPAAASAGPGVQARSCDPTLAPSMCVDTTMTIALGCEATSEGARNCTAAWLALTIGSSTLRLPGVTEQEVNGTLLICPSDGEGLCLGIGFALEQQGCTRDAISGSCLVEYGRSEPFILSAEDGSCFVTTATGAASGAADSWLTQPAGLGEAAVEVTFEETAEFCI